MRNYIDEIIQNLITQKAIYIEMCDVSKKMNDAVIASDSKSVSEYTALLQGKTKELITLEKARDALCAGLERESGERQDGIAALVKCADPVQAEELTRIQNEIFEVIEEQKNINKTAKLLLDTQVQYINYMINVVSGETVAGNTYGDTGAAKNKDSKLYDTTV